MIRSTSTVNVKPQSINAKNIVPNFIGTLLYGGYTEPNNLNQWGTFKWGSGHKWGATTKYSVGQPMPGISTVEI